MKKASKAIIIIIIFLASMAGGFAIVRANSYNDYAKRSGQSASVALANTAPVLPVMCNKPLYARVKFSSSPLSNFGVRNWGTGNLERAVYVGGSTPANKFNSGDWFMIYDGHNYKIDPDVSGYEAVKGLAVQRVAGGVRVVLHGSLEEPAGAPLTNRERVQAGIEFSHDKLKRATDIIPDVLVSDSENPIDYTSGKGTNDPQDDRIEIVSNLAQFKLVVNANDDGFYTYYKNTNPGCK